MSFNINEFRSALKFGGARTNLFKVKLTNPIDGSSDSILPFLCNAANLPQRTTNPIDVSYFGRKIKVAGVVQNYENWQVKIINDEDFKIRNALETWQTAINSPEGNRRMLGTSEPSLYKSVAEVTALSQAGPELRTYKMIGIWPTEVGEIAMDWGQENVSTFQVTFAVDYWIVADTSPTGLAGGPGI
jgi:hypothetical protein